MKCTTRVSFKLDITIDNSWEDGASVRQIHSDAGSAARNIINRLLQGETRLRAVGPVNIETVLIADEPK